MSDVVDRPDDTDGLPHPDADRALPPLAAVRSPAPGRPPAGRADRPVRPDAVGPAAAAPGRSARQRRSEWRRAEKARRYAARNSVRFPIFTRSVLLWMLIFALVGLAFGASGAFWWAHFNTQVSQLRSDTQDFETRSQSASADIEKQTDRRPGADQRRARSRSRAS